MADFWENFAEAMGWGKANHTAHLSDLSEEKKQGYRNRYTDSANKSYEKENPGTPKIENAKQNGGDPFFTRDDDDFVGEYNSNNDMNYETRIYNFRYAAPTNGKSVDNSATEFRSGKVLVRAPKYKESVSGAFGSKSPWFDDKNFAGSNLGVYEAVLDDGTVLNADQFKDLVQTNQYGQFKLGTQESTDKKASDRLQIFKDYKDKMKSREYETRWDRNWRGFRSNIPVSNDNTRTYEFYFKPGPNGE